MVPRPPCDKLPHDRRGLADMNLNKSLSLREIADTPRQVSAPPAWAGDDPLYIAYHDELVATDSAPLSVGLS